MVEYSLISSSDRPNIEAWHYGKIYARALELYEAKMEIALEGRRECG
jgi:hypothetical protein